MSNLISQDSLTHSLLFTESLYLLSADKKAKHQSAQVIEEINTPSQTLVYTGNKHVKLIIIVNEPEEKIVGSDDWQALSKTLAALNLDINSDVAFINLHANTNLNAELIHQYLVYECLVFFGINPTILNFEAILANTVTSINGKSYLATWQMKKIRESVDKKNIFWREMKNLIK